MLNKRIIIICNFVGTTKSGILKVLTDANRKSTFASKHLFTLTQTDDATIYKSKITAAEPYLYISQETIQKDYFTNWQILLISDALNPEQYPQNVFDSNTLVMYHTAPANCETVLETKNIYFKKRGEHEPGDPQHGYPLINFIVDAYIDTHDKFDNTKYNEALVNLIGWFKNNPKLGAKIKLVQDVLSGKRPTEIDPKIDNATQVLSSIKELPKGENIFSIKFQTAFNHFYKMLGLG